jgi:glycine cleavage system P protein (glycine dehydrogenase) subunit 1
LDFIPHTSDEIAEMIKAIGLKKPEDLFKDIPEGVRFPEIKFPDSLSEPEILQEMANIAALNRPAVKMNSFLGAGSYDHTIPSVIDEILSRTEFYTAYTPYQPEISQGILQAIFEYQSMISALTCLPVSNASLYDGASATAEAAWMCLSHMRNKRKILVSEGLHPNYKKVLDTYYKGNHADIITIPLNNGHTDMNAASELIDTETACLILQQPNFFGCLEPVEQAGEIANKAGIMYVSVVNPISLGILTPPGEYGAHIAVGEGQSFGSRMNFGGPGLGFMTCTKKLMRKIPGRVVGMAQDINMKRGFVLTLQAREQHIRREKATSNICSNQALNALAAAVYLAFMGKEGIKKVAELCLTKAHMLAGLLTKIRGFSLKYTTPFFHEFVLHNPVNSEEVNRKLIEYGINGGLPLGKFFPGMKNESLLCVTETKTKKEIDELIFAIERITAGENAN